MRLRSFLASLVMLASVTGCETTSRGIGGGSAAMSPGISAPAGIEVLKIDFDSAMIMAEKAGKLAYEDVRRTGDDSGLYITNRSFLMGDAQALVQPVLVRDIESGDIGIIYEVKAEGVGGHFSMVPGYVSSAFFDKLRTVIAESKVERATFAKYEQLKDKGVPGAVGESVPTDYAEFAKYLDQRRGRDPFEGIWITSGNDYTLGMVRDDGDPRYRYKAFILETKRGNWKPGEIKIKFTNLNNGLAIGSYFLGNKRESGVTFEATPDFLVSLPDAGVSGRILLTKIYPSQGGPASGGPSSGSAWHVGNGFFVTNAHVIEGGGALKLTVGRSVHNAHLVAQDKKLDLAIVKIADGAPPLPAIPLASDVKQGRNIFAVGFPLGKMLGEGVKITNGIVSALEGFGGDPTVLGITAAVQPGNSGGPVIDEDGRVVGVVVSKLRNAENVNYAVKVDYLLPLLKQVGAPASFASNARKIDICATYCGSVALLEVGAGPAN